MPRTDPRFARYSEDLTRKTCAGCEVERPVEEFRWKRHWRGDHRYHLCRACDSLARRRHRERRRLAAERPRAAASPFVAAPDLAAALPLPAFWAHRQWHALSAATYAALTDEEIALYPRREVRAVLRSQRRAARVALGLEPPPPCRRRP